MYTFENPEYFYWLAIIPLMWIVFFLYRAWQIRVQRQFGETALLERLAPQQSYFKSILKMIFWSLGWAMIIIALVNPKIGTALKTVKRSGVDVVFALDVSRSMLAEDVAPNRLEKAKWIAGNIINKLGGDRVGIVVYAGNAYTLLPITTDQNAAKMFLETANPDMVSNQGTAIGEALLLAQKSFDNAEQTNRFLFIISDGEDHEQNIEDNLNLVTKSGIKVFTIGLGTEKGAPIPISKIGGIQYKKDNEGNMVITQFHPQVLQEIAQAGKGLFVDGNKSKEAVDQITKVLNNADKKTFEAKEFSDYKDQFPWFIGLALFFFVLEFFILERKTAWLEKLNLFNEKAKN